MKPMNFPSRKQRRRESAIARHEIRARNRRADKGQKEKAAYLLKVAEFTKAHLRENARSIKTKIRRDKQ